MEWINIQTRKPAKSGTYIVWTDKNEWELASFYELKPGKWYSVFSEDRLNTDGTNITHWIDITAPDETLSEKIPQKTWCSFKDMQLSSQLEHIHHELWHLVEEVQKLNRDL